MNNILNFFYFFSILTLDQLSKYWVHSSFVEGEPVAILPNFFNLTLVYNPGAAFGIFSGLPDTQRRVVLLGVSVLALLVVVRLLLTDAKDDKYSQFALLGILAGALGNIIDRFRFDRVVDFLDFYWGSYHWPAFNVADSAISVGVAILIIRMTCIRSQISGKHSRGI